MRREIGLLDLRIQSKVLANESSRKSRVYILKEGLRTQQCETMKSVSKTHVRSIKAVLRSI